MQHLMKCILAPALAAAVGTSSCLNDQPNDHMALVQRYAKKSVGNCPSKEHPTVLYNHITKTGGTAVKQLLQAVVPEGQWKVEDNLEKHRLSPQKKEKAFVIGLVRRPCDFLVSWYYQLRSHCDLKSDETKHLNCNNNGVKSKLAAQFKDFVNDTEASAPHRMSTALDARYGTDDNVHCMMRAHNLKADFIACMDQYQACGGTINNATKLEDLTHEALHKAVGVAREAGRGVGNHPACSKLVDKDLEATVLETEGTVVSKYNLEACCSSNSNPFA